MARDETDDTLPSQDVAKEFYAKYEPKEILGRCVHACPHFIPIDTF
jgi:phosphorylase kinase gamma subunit